MHNVQNNEMPDIEMLMKDDDEVIMENDEWEDEDKNEEIIETKKSKKNKKKKGLENKPKITYDDDEENQEDNDAIKVEDPSENIELFKSKLNNIIQNGDFSEKRSRKLSCDDFLELLA